MTVPFEKLVDLRMLEIPSDVVTVTSSKLRMLMRLLCDECGRPFVREPWRQGRPQRFCSSRCRNRVAARTYRQRQKRRLQQAEEAARLPAATDEEVRQAVVEAFVVLDELDALQAGLRVPQRMDEAALQTEQVRATLHNLTGRLQMALLTVARDRPTGERHP